MRYMLTLGLLCLALMAWADRLPPLPECYHTYAEITAELEQLQTQYPTIARIYTLGYSQQDSLPIYAMKISDNVNLDEQMEPAVLLIGQVHAEEVLGVETTMSNINYILSHRQSAPYSQWIAQLEMWFVPTLNPEGHNVVTSNLDPSYRKNKHDLNNNGVLDYSTLVGYDSDGVDINRNFSFNFCHGDTLYQPGGTEVWDYYRGEAPYSETETQALRNFCDEQMPVSCIIWHSSRTGLLSEKVYYPLNYYDCRPSPDLALAQQIGEGVASQILKENGTAPYEASAVLGRKGSANDWMYQKYGTISMTIECGTSNLQPDSTLMVNTINRLTNGVWWLLNRAMMTSPNVPSSSMLTGTITDAVTSLPLRAEIIVEEKNAPWFGPRMSFQESGRFFRPVSNGTYNLRFRKKGYSDYIINSFNVNNGSWTAVQAPMQPLPPATVHLTLTNGDVFIPGHVVWYDVENDVYDFNGEGVIHTFAGSHKVEITSEGFYPYVGELPIAAGEQNIHINLSPVQTSNLIFSENWENGASNWTIQGPWVVQDVLAANGHAITDSWGGRGFYAQQCNVWIKTNNAINLPAGQNPMLIFDQHLYTEFVYDSVRVEISTDNANWQAVYTKTGQYDWWHPVYADLSDFAGQSVYLRFRLTDISASYDLTDPGWTIDNIKVITGTAVATDTTDIASMAVLRVYPIFPNPFNPEANIRFAIKDRGEVNINIYNIKGQKVKNMAKEVLNKGTHQVVWNGTDDKGKSVGNGIYFCRIKVGHQIHTLKMVMMK